MPARKFVWRLLDKAMEFLFSNIFKTRIGPRSTRIFIISFENCRFAIGFAEYIFIRF